MQKHVAGFSVLAVTIFGALFFAGLLGLSGIVHADNGAGGSGFFASHFVCQGTSCVSISGVGTDQCSPGNASACGGGGGGGGGGAGQWTCVGLVPTCINGTACGGTPPTCGGGSGGGGGGTPSNTLDDAKSDKDSSSQCTTPLVTDSTGKVSCQVYAPGLGGTNPYVTIYPCGLNGGCTTVYESQAAALQQAIHDGCSGVQAIPVGTSIRPDGLPYYYNATGCPSSGGGGGSTGNAANYTGGGTGSAASVSQTNNGLSSVFQGWSNLSIAFHGTGNGSSATGTGNPATTSTAGGGGTGGMSKSMCASLAASVISNTLQTLIALSNVANTANLPAPVMTTIQNLIATVTQVVNALLRCVNG